MSLKKYKYYFKKPKSEIVKDIFSWLLMSGAVVIAASSPYFVLSIMRDYKRWKRYPSGKVYDAFYNLKRQGYLDIKEKNHQIYISLTEKGRRKAGWLQINHLKIKRPKKWDKKWRIVIFDISQTRRIKREALRGTLKEMKFCPLQKSVWIHAFDCRAEIELLKTFFGLTDKEIRLIIAGDIGNDEKFKRSFRII